MNRLNPTAMALLGGVVVLLLLLFVFTRGGNENSDRLSDDQIAAGAATTDPGTACASPATYDLIKRQLFRSAALLRGSDQAAFDTFAAASVVRMDAPMLKSSDAQRGTISCTGSLALDLPPGVAVGGGRRTLTADIEYGLQLAADGGSTGLTLTDADTIITPLSTLAKIGAPAVDPLAPTNQVDQVGAPPVTTEPLPAPPPPAPLASRANPSFNCQNAHTPSEYAVCHDSGLATLDRQMAAQFNNAVSQADPAQRTILLTTRSRFLAYRDQCRSDDCIADGYRGRINEIRDIMAGRWREP